MTVRPRVYVGHGGARRPQLTQLGRPDWDEIFGAIKQARPSSSLTNPRIHRGAYGTRAISLGKPVVLSTASSWPSFRADPATPARGQAHPDETVGVFYCGNPALEKVLRRKCGAWSDRGTWFRMHAEKF